MFELQKRIEIGKRPGSIQIMAHTVLGYPSPEINREIIRSMVKAKAEIVELQIPFSEPMADGTTITRANQEALASKISTGDFFRFVAECIREHPKTIFILMTYTNIVYRFGFENFIRCAKEIGVLGCIVPDLPPEHGSEYLSAAKKHEIAPIHIFTPTTTPERMKLLDQASEGMIYCVGRTGVTGKQTKLDDSINGYLRNCRENTDLPLALGFGIRSPEDVRFLKGKVEIVVLGSKLIELIDQGSVSEMESFLKSLRPEIFSLSG